MKRPGLADALASATGAILLGPMTASAHGPATSSAPAIAVRATSDLAAAATSAILLGALAVGIALGLRRPRRLVAGLAMLVLVLASEAGLHSAHHVGAPRDAAACSVAVTTAHLSGSPVEAVTIAPDAAPMFRGDLPARRVAVARHRPAPHEGRAPPASTV
jgi:hypothetical protein